MMVLGEGPSMTHLERIGEFGDVRRAARGAWLFARIVAVGSLVLRQVGGDRAGEIAAHRFLASRQVRAEEITETLSARTGERCRGRRIVAVQDTTEINFSGRDRARRGLGPAGDGKAPGFFIHAVIAVDTEDEAVVGLLDATIWTRKVGKRPSPRRKRPLAEKESQRWLTATQVVAERVEAATQLIMVGDRESDIFALFAHRPAGVELVVRAAQDRALADGTRLFARAAGWPALVVCEVKVGPRGPGDKGRTAKVTLRAGPVRVARPRNGADRNDPKYLDLSLVEAREEQPPPGSEAIHWRLITTLPAGDIKAATTIVQFYRPRWRDKAGSRCRRTRHPGRCRSDWRDAGRQDAAPEKSPPAPLLALAVLDHCTAWRLELLLQAPRTQDDARRLGSVCGDGRRLPHCQGDKPLILTYNFRESRSPQCRRGATTCALKAPLMHCGRGGARPAALGGGG